MGTVEWQPHLVQLGGGVDTKSDEKRLLPGKVARLENGVFTKRGAIRKRNGYRALGNTFAGTTSGTIGAARILTTRDDELVLMDGSRAYSYVEALDKWADRGPYVPVSLSQRTVAKVVAEQTHADMATNGTVTVVAWEDSRGTVRYSVLDAVTGAVIVADTSIGANSSQPKVCYVNGFFHLYWRDSTAVALKLSRFTAAAPFTAPTTSSIYTDLRTATTPVYDVQVYANNVYVAYTQTLTSLGVGRVSAAGSATAATAYATTTEVVTLAIAVAPNGFSAVAHTNTTISNVAIFDTGLVNTTSTGALVQKYDRVSVGIETALTNGGDYNGYVFGEVANASPYLARVEVAPFTVINGGNPSTSTKLRHSCVASRGFVDSGFVYCNVVQDSTLQSTYFTVRSDGLIVAKSCMSIAGGRPVKAHLPNVQLDGTRLYRWAGIYRNHLDVENPTLLTANAVYAERGIKEITMDFAADAGRSAQKGRATYLTGGYESEYDGRTVVESGFHLFPENVSLTGNTGAGSPFLNGEQYWYRCYYEWTNDQGERELSTCFSAVGVTIGSDAKVVVATIPTLAHTHKTATGFAGTLMARTEVSIAIFRTQKNPSGQATFYRVSSPDPTTTGTNNGYLLNDPTADTVSWTDSLADATAATHEIDYQTGGGLDNLAPETASIQTAAQDRIWLAGVEDRNLVLYSKTQNPGAREAVEFNDSLQVRVDEEGGPIVGLAQLDDKVVVFTESRIYVVLGEGINNGGGGQDPQAQLVTTDVGCIDQRTIAEMPLGVMFQSAKGIRLLTRSMETVDIGADVLGLVQGKTFTSALLVADANQVRFLAESGLTLCYDYEFGQWSTFTAHTGATACIWRDTYTYARSSGLVLVEDSSIFQDNGQPYSLLFETGWLNFGLLQGYQRVKCFLLLGTFLSSHRLQWQVGYNYEPAFTPAVEFDAASLMNVSNWGSDATWGSGATWGGDGDSVYQWQGNMDRQKVESIKLRFLDVSSGPQGPAYDIADLVLWLGIKKTPFKLRGPRRGGPGAVPANSIPLHVSGWNAGTDMPTARVDFAYGQFGDGTVIMTGGYDGAADNFTTILWDPAADTYTAGPDIPADGSVRYCCGVVCADDTFLVYGLDGFTSDKTGLIYTKSTGLWTKTANAMPTQGGVQLEIRARQGETMMGLLSSGANSGKVVCYTSRATASYGRWVALLYDPTAKTFGTPLSNFNNVSIAASICHMSSTSPNLPVNMTADTWAIMKGGEGSDQDPYLYYMNPVGNFTDSVSPYEPNNPNNAGNIDPDVDGVPTATNNLVAFDCRLQQLTSGPRIHSVMQTGGVDATPAVGTALAANPTGVVRISAYTYNLARSEVIPPAKMTVPRAGHVFSRMTDGRLIAAGGGTTATSEILDETALTWSDGGDMTHNSAGMAHALVATWQGDTALLAVFGGYEDGITRSVVTKKVSVYLP